MPPTPVTRAQIAHRLEGWLPGTAAVEIRSEGGVFSDLFPEERETLARAIPKRRREFALGRESARAALGRLGVPPQPIPVGSNREPLWPGGWTGSISHSGEIAAAVVAPRRDVTGIGLDVEARAPLPTDVASRVLHPAERSAAERAGVPDVALFSAKEAIHKTLFPETRIVMGFLDVEVLLDSRGAFRVTPSVDGGGAAPGVRSLRGRILVADDFVYTLAWLPNSTE